MTLESSIIISSVGIGVAITLAMMGLLIRQVNRGISSLEHRMAALELRMTALERGQSEFQQEMRAEFAAFKQEIRTDLSEFRQEMRAEMSEFREEMRTEMSEFREEMRTSVEKLDIRLRAVEHNQERFSGQVSTLERFVVESIRARQADQAPAPVEAD